MNKNEYEAAVVVEIGQAHDLILGVKDVVDEDNGGMPMDRWPAAFAKFEE